MTTSHSELQVITAAKNLCSYVMTITQKSPKQFRFSLVGRMLDAWMNSGPSGMLQGLFHVIRKQSGFPDSG